MNRYSDKKALFNSFQFYLWWEQLSLSFFSTHTPTPVLSQVLKFAICKGRACAENLGNPLDSKVIDPSGYCSLNIFQPRCTLPCHSPQRLTQCRAHPGSEMTLYLVNERWMERVMAPRAHCRASLGVKGLTSQAGAPLGGGTGEQEGRLSWEPWPPCFVTFSLSVASPPCYSWFSPF